MARIYSLDGYLAADGLQGCETSDEAMAYAMRLADEWDEPVELEDDDGTWHVYPIGEDGVRPLAEPQIPERDDDEPADFWGEDDAH